MQEDDVKKSEVVRALNDIKGAITVLINTLEASNGEAQGEAAAADPSIPFQEPAAPSQGEYPKQVACPRCGVQVFAQWSQRKNKVYYTNTINKTDFHNDPR